jgi:hypothetical protein
MPMSDAPLFGRGANIARKVAARHLVTENA